MNNSIKHAKKKGPPCSPFGKGGQGGLKTLTLIFCIALSWSLGVYAAYAATTETWTQTNWSGGSSLNAAGRLEKTGWTEYQSTSNAVTADASGVKLTQQTGQIVHTTYNDFYKDGEGVVSQAVINGSGSPDNVTSGNIVLKIGQSILGNTVQATSFTPNKVNGVAVDTVNNKIYTTDSGNRILRFDSGLGGTAFGANQQIFGSASYFNRPQGIAVDPVNNKVYVADYTNKRIARFDSGSGGTSFGGSWQTFGGSYNSLGGIDVDPVNNKVYFVQANNFVVIDSGSGGTSFGGNPTVYGTYGSVGPGKFGATKDIAVDSVNNKLYITDYAGKVVVRMDSGSGGTALGGNWEYKAISITQFVTTQVRWNDFYYAGMKG